MKRERWICVLCKRNVKSLTDKEVLRCTIGECTDD